ncbi:hypothetical protein H0G86_010752 [Trichoderma simmonsii]|uniref:Uncharacterized protein n=1 Tax=Trichoderma simmonsii TaxID=1491479 RepID=A0A8G0PP98_9HYPO|nr:hypothetical protein H0G86_010752 [Trichoderma simmonsii]
MSTSSTGAVYGNNNTCNELHDPSANYTQPAALASVPDNPTESIERFLNNRNSSTLDIAAKYQRPPIELREAQEEAEADLSGDQNS